MVATDAVDDGVAADGEAATVSVAVGCGEPDAQKDALGECTGDDDAGADGVAIAVPRAVDELCALDDAAPEAEKPAAALAGGDIDGDKVTNADPLGVALPGADAGALGENSDDCVAESSGDVESVASGEAVGA